MYRQYLGGRTAPGTGAEAHVVNPATEEKVGSYLQAGEDQAREALLAAREGFKHWSSLSLNQREEWILKLTGALAQEKESLLDILMSETGKTYVKAEYDYQRLIDCLRFFISAAKNMHDTIIPDYDNKFRHFIVRQPIGVVVGYLAWNFPLLNLGYKLGPVLASGCSCVIKPASATPLTTLHIGEIAEGIGFPAGVMNFLAGPTKTIAPVLSGSDIPRMITIIGSTRAGREVIEQSSASVKKYSLELGGNAPVVVMPDADIEQAASTIVNLKFNLGGQVCITANRVLVHESIHRQCVEALKRYTEKIRLGWGRDKDAQMGPLITRADQERMKALVDDAVARGARLVCGGSAPGQPERGYYFLPTILDDVKDGMRVYAEEIFGPIIPVSTFSSEEEAIAMANDTRYGLAAYLYTKDVARVFRMSEAIEAGTVCVNEPRFNYNLPHGGIKESGVGKDCSIYSLDEYYYIKRISIKA